MKRRHVLKLAALLPLTGCATDRTGAGGEVGAKTGQAGITTTQPTAGASGPAAESAAGASSSAPASASVSATRSAADPVASLSNQAPTSFGMHLPGIVDTVPTVHGSRTIALTFDACGGETDQALIDTLREYRVPATLFLARPWVEAHPDATRHLIADPLFRIENHGTRHVPLSANGQAAYGIAGTATLAEAREEIKGNAALLQRYGVRADWFRAGTAHYDDVALQLAEALGVKIAGFSVNGDFGATAAAGQVAANITAAQDGAIVLAHMNHPGSGTAAGVRQALDALSGGGVRFAFIDGTRP